MYICNYIYIWPLITFRIYILACVYICWHIYLAVSIFGCSCIYIWLYPYLAVHVFIFGCIHIGCSCIHIWLYLYLAVHVFIFGCIYIWVFMYLYLVVSMYSDDAKYQISAVGFNLCVISDKSFKCIEPFSPDLHDLEQCVVFIDYNIVSFKLY